MGLGTPTAALVEQNNAVNGGIKVAAHGRAATAPWTTVQDEDRDAIPMTALFDKDAVPIAHVDHPLIKGVDRRVKKFDCALLA